MFYRSKQNKRSSSFSFLGFMAGSGEPLGVIEPPVAFDFLRSLCYLLFNCLVPVEFALTWPKLAGKVRA
jgi:hypothetical protein